MWILFFLAVLPFNLPSTASQDCTSMNCTRPTKCQGTNSTEGTSEWKCLRHAEGEKSECKYVFEFNSTVLRVPEGETVIFRCNESIMMVFDHKVPKQEHLNATRVAEFKHHGAPVSCFTGNSRSVNATLDILSPPKFEEKKINVEGTIGEKSYLNISFWANPPVSRADVKISHNGKNLTNFFFRRNGIFYVILLHFDKVAESDFGDYAINVKGEDEFCSPKDANITAKLSRATTLLHNGWITSIVLGAVLFIVLVAVIIVHVMQRRQKQESQIPPATQPQINQPEEDLRNAAQSEPVRYQNSNVTFQNDDEYEDPNTRSSPPASRPPMPLPPEARGGTNRFPPSPGRSPRLSPVPGRYDASPRPSPRRGRMTPMQVAHPSPWASGLRPPITENSTYFYGQDYLDRGDPRTLPSRGAYERPLPSSPRHGYR